MKNNKLPSAAALYPSKKPTVPILWKVY